MIEISAFWLGVSLWAILTSLCLYGIISTRNGMGISEVRELSVAFMIMIQFITLTVTVLTCNCIRLV